MRAFVRMWIEDQPLRGRGSKLGGFSHLTILSQNSNDHAQIRYVFDGTELHNTYRCKQHALLLPTHGNVLAETYGNEHNIALPSHVLSFKARMC